MEANPSKNVSSSQPQYQPRSRLLPVIIGFILILLAITGAYFLGKQTALDKVSPTPTPIPMISPTPVVQSQDILDLIAQWTVPMQWSKKISDTATYRANGQVNQEIKLTGVSISSSIPDKSADKLAPLTSSNNSQLKSAGWIEDANNEAGGVQGMLFVYYKDQNSQRQVLTIWRTSDSNGIQYKAFLSNVFTLSISDNWQSQTIQKVSWASQWRSFTLSYPDSWTYHIDRSGNPEHFTITLTKGTAMLRIMQVQGDESACNYPDEPQKDGMVTKYNSYLEIAKGNGLTWRLSHMQDDPGINQPRYKVCERNDATATSQFLPFTGITSIGMVNLTDTSGMYDSALLQEVKGILEKIVLQ